MLKTTCFLIAGLVAGIAIATLWSGGARAPVSRSADGASATERLDALEAALREEQSRRLELEEELAGLEARLDASVALVGAADGALADASSRRTLDDASADAPGDVPPPLQAELMSGPRARFGRDDEGLVERFVAAGISVDRAQWIVRRQEELRMEALQAQYDAAREGTPLAERLALMPPTSALREELGDADYERYLQALDRPTSVFVRDVLSTSPGAQAGLQAGDQVVGYGGERVFDMSDINRLVLEGQPGEMVAIDVLREGQPIQLYLPRGPIGITGGGRGGRVR